MDNSSIDLPGSEIESIDLTDDRIIVRFSRAYITKTMSGSAEHTRWWQSGELIFSGAEVEGEIPSCPCVCDGGDVGENVYTYRDMIPIPLVSSGRAHCDLRFRGSAIRLRIQGEGVELVMRDRPYYIEHIKPDS